MYSQINSTYFRWGLTLALIVLIVLAAALSPVYAPPAQAQGTSTVSFQKDFVDALEDDGTKEITLTVTPALTTASTVKLRSLPGDARHNAPDDAYDLPGSVAIPAGQSAVTFDVTLTDDNLVQGKGQYDRVLTIGLVAPSGAPYQLGKKKTRLNIGDDDVATISFERSEYEVAEGGSVAATIKLDRPLTFDIIVYLRTLTDADADTENATPEVDYNAWSDYFVRLYNGATKPTLQPKMSTYADDVDDAGEVFQLEIYRVQALVNDRDAATYTVEIGSDPATIKITAPQSPGDNDASQVQNLEVLQGGNELYMRWEPSPLTITSYELHYTSAGSDVANSAAKTSGTDASQGWVNANLDTDLSERINGTLRGLASETAYRIRIRGIRDGTRTVNNQKQQYRIASGKWVFHGPVSTRYPPLHPLNVSMRPGNARAYLEFNRPPWEVSGYHIGVRLEGEELREEIVSYRPTKPYGGEGTIKYVLDHLTNGTTYMISVRSCLIREINPYAPTGCGRWTEEQAITPEGAISTFPTDQTGPVRLHRGPGALLVEWDHFGSTGTYRIHYTSDPQAGVNDSIHTSETDPAFGWVDTGFVHQDFGGAKPNFLIKGLVGGKEHKVRIESRGTFGTGWRLVQAIPVQPSRVWIVNEHKEISIDEHFGGFRDIKQVRVAIYPFLEKEIAIRFRAEDGTAKEGVDFTILPHFTYIPAFAKSAPLTIKSTGPDRVTDGNKTATIRIISEREFYQADPERETVALTVVDNSKTQESDDEMSNFWLGREYVTVEEGGTLKYQVGFRGNPTANVTISARVAYDDSNGRLQHDISRSPATLTWRKSGGLGGSDEFTLQVRDDNVAQGDVVYYILHHLDSNDANYDSDRQFHSLAEDQAAILKVTVTDNDSNQGAPVNRAPTVARPIADVDDLPVGDSRQISLSGVFRYAGFGKLTIFAASSDDTVARVSADLDGSSLTVSGESAGTATIRVIAEDPQGNRVFDEFDVTVTGSDQLQQINHVPTVSGPIANATIINEAGTKQVTLSGVFSDADGDNLTITAGSSHENVATVAVSGGQASLTVTAQARGATTITVTAADGYGGSVQDSFTVRVKSAPAVTSPIGDITGLEAGERRTISLSGVFSDDDGETPTVTRATSSDSSTATVTTAIDSLTRAVTGLTVVARSEGAATITVTAEDSDGNTVQTTFNVTVNTSDRQKQQPAEPQPVKNLTCRIDSEQVTFKWDRPSWPGGTASWYDLDVTLPSGKQFSERRHVDLRSRTDRGRWKPGTEARISVKALYDLPGGDRVTSTAVEMTCVVPSAPNSAPTVVGDIADATIVNQGGTKEIPLDGVFSDADRDDLNISAGSSAESVATVAVSADHSTLTVTARARGTANVTVAATDPYGGTVSDSFSVKVKAAPVVASAIADANMALYGSRQIDLSTVFSDADGDTLTYKVSSTDEDVVAVYEFHGAMSVLAIAEGQETVTVTAQDSDENRVINTFEVTVGQEQREEPQEKKEASQQQAQTSEQGSEQPPDQNPPDQGQPADPQSSGQPGQEQPLNQQPAGSTGSTGATGSTGPTGSTGSSGSTGSDGAAGRVTAAYQQPQADAGPDRAVPAGRVATLDGSGSSGPQGTANGQLSWFWSQASGPKVMLAGARGPRPSFTVPEEPGKTLSFWLTVQTPDGWQHSDQVTMVVTDAQPAPAPAAQAWVPQAGHLAVVWHFDQAGQRWRFYDPAVPEFSDLREMTPGQVYLVQVKATFQAVLGGKVRHLTCVNGNCWNQIIW